MKSSSSLAAGIAAALWAIAGSGIDLASAAPIPTLFNTGIATNNPDGTPATLTADEEHDEHYTIVAGVIGAATPYVTKTGQFPFGPWGSDNATSRWISPQKSYPGTTKDPVGSYTYRTTFDLSRFDPGTVAISGRVEFDDELAAIRINGFDIGVSKTSGIKFNVFTPFSLPGGHYVSGVNELEFDVSNRVEPSSLPNPSGFRAELTGTGEHSLSDANLASLVPNPGTLAPVFTPATTSYTANVPDTTTSMKVTPTASDPAATIQVRVNGGSYSPVASGTASAALPLEGGDNTIDVKVTALDSTTKIYTIAVSIPKLVGTWAERTVVRTLAPNFSGEVDIGALTFRGGTGSIEAAVKATGTGWTISKRYMIPIRNDLGNGSPPNTWLKVLPTHDTGANGVNNFDLEINVSGATAQLRLRTVGTNAETAAARIALKTIGLQTFVNSTATTAFVEAPTQTLAGNAVDEWKGNAGVGAEPGASAVIDVNGGNTRGLHLHARSKAGAPTTGAWSKGTIILDSAANLFICTAAGTPGTWKKVGN